MTITRQEVFLSTILPNETFASLQEAEEAERNELLIQLLESDAGLDRWSASSAVRVIIQSYHLTHKDI